MLNSIDLLAKILGFLALYGIALALLDWRRTARYQRELNEILKGKDGPK